MENEKQIPAWLQPPPCSHVNMRLKTTVIFLIISVMFIIYIIINQEGPVTKSIAVFVLVIIALYMGYIIFNLPTCLSSTDDNGGGSGGGGGVRNNNNNNNNGGSDNNNRAAN